MTSRTLRTVLVCALGLWVAAPGLAQAPSNEAAAASAGQGGTGARRRARGRRPATPALTISRPGFQMGADGSSRFVVQVSGTPTWETRTSRRRLEVRVSNARLAERNDRQPLETRFFETPVLRMKLEPRGHDVYVVFELRSDATPTVTVEVGVNGSSRLVATFGAGQFRTEGERRAVEESLNPTSVQITSTTSPTPPPAPAPGTPAPTPVAPTPTGYDEERPPAMHGR